MPDTATLLVGDGQVRECALDLLDPLTPLAHHSHLVRARRHRPLLSPVRPLGEGCWRVAATPARLHSRVAQRVGIVTAAGHSCGLGNIMALRSQTQRTLLLSAIGWVACCGLVGIYCLLVGRLGDLAVRILLTTTTAGAASILALASAIPWEQRRWHPIGPCGITAVTIATLLTLIAIWFEPAGAIEVYDKTMFSAWVMAVVMPHAGLLSLARLGLQYEWVRRLTAVIILLLGAQIIASIWAEIGEEFWYRVMGTLGIAGVCGTITVPILHRISAIHTADQTFTVDMSEGIGLTCPRCHTLQKLPLGRSKCPQCGLKLSIQIEEEHCRHCGYVLYRIESPICPECGTPIAETGEGESA